MPPGPEDMIRSRYTDWIASIEDGYHLLKGITDNVFLIGLSMGGRIVVADVHALGCEGRDSHVNSLSPAERLSSLVFADGERSDEVSTQDKRSSWKRLVR